MPRQAKPGYGSTVEIDLELSNATVGDFARVIGLNVRRHSTERDARDRLAAALPADREASTRALLGDEVFDWLTNPSTEIPGIIDWAKLQKYNNGGCSLYICVRDEYRDRVPVPSPSGRLAA